MHGRRVLVTGGAGFVGSHLVDRLIARGAHVAVLDDLSTGVRDQVDPRADLTVGDVRDRALVARMIGACDACFHLAAIASVPQCAANWADSHHINLSAFVGLLEASAKRAGGPVPVVYASSAAVYGDSQTLPAHEGLMPQPLSTYGADKAGCELHARAAGTAGVPTFGIRPFNIYGPRQNPASPYSGVISIFADRIKRGLPLTIYGDGRQTRDFIHVDDAVSHFIAAMSKASVEALVCNAATGMETSVAQVAALLGQLFGVSPQISLAPARAGDIRRSVADTARAREILGCRAGIAVADGLTFVLKA